MTIYIVTGDGPRCGSTMMMRALEAGGLELAFDPACDLNADVQERDGYHPAEDGLYELPMPVQLTDGFPGPEYEGKCLKSFCPPWGPLTHLIGGDYRVVWMHRDSTARWKSFAKFYGKFSVGMMDSGAFATIAKVKDMAVGAGWFVVNARADMEVVRLNYKDVLSAPLKAFESLGWPIDALKASKVVDPLRRRF